MAYSAQMSAVSGRSVPAASTCCASLARVLSPGAHGRRRPVSPNHHVAALPSRLLTLDEAEERRRARQPWADLWRRRVRDTGNDAPQAVPRDNARELAHAPPTPRTPNRSLEKCA